MLAGQGGLWKPCSGAGPGFQTLCLWAPQCLLGSPSSFHLGKQTHSWGSCSTPPKSWLPGLGGYQNISHFSVKKDPLEETQTGWILKTRLVKSMLVLVLWWARLLGLGDRRGCGSLPTRPNSCLYANIKANLSADNFVVSRGPSHLSPVCARMAHSTKEGEGFSWGKAPLGKWGERLGQIYLTCVT